MTGEAAKMLDRRTASRVDWDETNPMLMGFTRPGASWGTTCPLVLKALPRLFELREKKLMPFGSSDGRRARTATSSKLHISTAAHSNAGLTPPQSRTLLNVLHLTLLPNLSSSSSSMAWPWFPVEATGWRRMTENNNSCDE